LLGTLGSYLLLLASQDVYPDSPAQAAGLQPYADYVVGNAEQIFTSADDFLNLVQVCASDDVFASEVFIFLQQNSYGRPLQLFVYNLDRDDVRAVTITPNPDWGGTGRHDSYQGSCL
jgi:hypothetical protein